MTYIMKQRLQKVIETEEAYYSLLENEMSKLEKEIDELSLRITRHREQLNSTE